MKTLILIFSLLTVACSTTTTSNRQILIKDIGWRFEVPQKLSFNDSSFNNEGILTEAIPDNNRRYYLNDCDLSLEDDIEISSPDDGEVSIYMPIGYKNRTLIKDIFRMKGLSETLIEEIMKMPGYYFSIIVDGKVESAHKTFDDYLNRNK